MYFKEDVCIHYNGTASIRCKAGIMYKDATKNGKGTFSLLPCFSKNDLAGNCTKYRLPSQQEIDEQEKEIADYINRMGTVRREIKDHIESRGMNGRNTSGRIQCPMCDDGEVTYSYAGAYNGHISASCSNGCVNWIE